MEANLIVKAADLTPDFADGISKVFSKDAVLHIKIEYNLNNEPAPAGKKRGPKPKGTVNAVSGKKRGRKPNSEKATPSQAAEPKKRGPKPKATLK